MDVVIDEKGAPVGGTKSCVGSLSVLVFVNDEGKPSVKVEHWVPDHDISLDLLVMLLPGVGKYLSGKRSKIIQPRPGQLKLQG